MTDSNLQSNAVVASANSQFISIVPENGEQFRPGQKIIYNIEPEIGFIKKDSYMVFDVLNDSAEEQRFCFHKNLGAHSIIDRVDIYSKETGVLLESNTHYAQWCNIENQYFNDSSDQLSQHEGVGKPIQSWKNYVDAAFAGKSVRSLADPMKIENNLLSPVDNNNDPAYTTRRFLIPLKVGLFGAYDAEEKAIPILAFGGLRIEITLQRPKLALQRLGFHYKNPASGETNLDDLLDVVAGLTTAAGGGNQTGTQNCAVTLDLGAAANVAFVNDKKATGLITGNTMTFTGTDGNGDYTYTGIINQILFAQNKDFVIDGKVHSGFQKMVIQLIGGGKAGPDGLLADGKLVAKNSPSYVVKKCEFRLLQIVPPPQVADSMSQGINYEYTGYEVFLNNVPTDVLRHQIPIHSVASKAIATFTQLYSTANDEGQLQSSADFYNGILPDGASLISVVYFINNRLYPLRAYNPQNKADKVLAINELVKAFRALGKQPTNLGNADYGNLDNYSNTPLICRELARLGMVFDLRNAEPELRLEFSAARTAVLRANTYVFSKKIVQTTATGVQVIH